MSRKAEAFKWVKIYTPMFALSFISGAVFKATPEYFKALTTLVFCFFGFCGVYVWGLAFISAMRSKFFHKELVKEDGEL